MGAGQFAGLNPITMIKLAVFVFCVVLATGTALPQPRDVFDDAASILETYRITVLSVLTQISFKFIETDTHIRQTGQAVANIASRIIINAQSEFMSQLTDLDEKAHAEGVDPMSCTYGAKRELSQWPYALIGNVERCIAEITRESDRSLRQAFSDFNHLNETVGEYQTKIDDCRTANDEICALIVITQISLHNDLLPILLEGDVEQIVNQFSNMEPYFQTCSSGPTDEIYTRGRIVVLTATQCIDNLLNSKP